MDSQSSAQEELAPQEKLRLGLPLSGPDMDALRKDSTSSIAIIENQQLLASMVIKALILVFIQTCMQILQERKNEDYEYSQRVKQADLLPQSQSPIPPAALPADQTSPQPDLKKKLANDWENLLEEIQNHPFTVTNTTTASVASRHSQIMNIWQNQVAAQLGPTLTLSTGTTINVPQNVNRPNPTAGQILMHNPGLANIVMNHADPAEKTKMQDAFALAVSLGQTGPLGVLKIVQNTQANNPEKELTQREIKELILKIDRQAKLINIQKANVKMPDVIKANNQLSLQLFKAEFKPSLQKEEIFAPPPPPPPPPPRMRM